MAQPTDPTTVLLTAIITLLVALAGVITAYLGYRKANQASVSADKAHEQAMINTEKTTALATRTDGRLDQLLETTGQLAKAAGIEEGRQNLLDEQAKLKKPIKKEGD